MPQCHTTLGVLETTGVLLQSCPADKTPGEDSPGAKGDQQLSVRPVVEHFSGEVSPTRESPRDWLSPWVSECSRTCLYN